MRPRSPARRWRGLRIAWAWPWMPRGRNGMPIQPPQAALRREDPGVRIPIARPTSPMRPATPFCSGRRPNQPASAGIVVIAGKSWSRNAPIPTAGRPPVPAPAACNAAPPGCRLRRKRPMRLNAGRMAVAGASQTGSRCAPPCSRQSSHTRFDRGPADLPGGARPSGGIAAVLPEPVHS